MVDVDAQLESVSRELWTEDLDGEDSYVQTLVQTFATPIDRVWDAVTSADRLPLWFLPVSGDLRLGGRYQLEGNAGGEIEECAPPAGGVAHFRATWEFGGGVSWIEVALRATDGGTRFELTHISRIADIPSEFWGTYGPGATGVGWDQALLGLALHLAGDPGIPPQAAQAWALSDEGVRFARGSADAWAAVHVSAGADAASAARAADATFAFYTGGDADA